jgi:hypothetical protein
MQSFSHICDNMNIILKILSFVFGSLVSDCAVGGVLSQLQDNQEKVIAYMSKALNKEEQNYCVTRKELLAVVSAPDSSLSLASSSVFLSCCLEHALHGFLDNASALPCCLPGRCVIIKL